MEIRVVNSKLDERQPDKKEGGRRCETGRGSATRGRVGQGHAPSWDFRLGQAVKTGSTSPSLTFKVVLKSSSRKRRLGDTGAHGLVAA